MNIRLIAENDYKKVADIIARAVFNSAFSKFYPQVSIDYIKESLDESGVKKEHHGHIFMSWKKIQRL